MKLYNFIIGELLELANREFRSEEFYKLKDLILILEKCTDAFESLAHEIETIAVKES